MSEHDFNFTGELRRLTSRLTASIRSQKQKNAVAREYEDHIRDAMQNYMLGGMSEEAAFLAAKDDLGDIEEIAVTLGDVHNRQEIPSDVGWKLDKRKLADIIATAIIIDVLLLSGSIFLWYIAFLWVLGFVFGGLRAVFKRLGAVGKLRRYAKTYGFACRISVSALLSLWWYADRPDVVLERDDVMYKIRFLPSIRPNTVIRFIGRNLYSVVYEKGTTWIASVQLRPAWLSFRPKNVRKLSQSGLVHLNYSVQGDIFALPTMECRHDSRDKAVEEVLIFNPVPLRVLYMTGSRETEIVGGEQKDGVWLHDIVSFGTMLRKLKGDL